MLEIVYCEEIVFDLPPPTLFYRSVENGFEQLIAIIEKMLIDKSEVCLKDCDFVTILGTTKRIIYRPFSSQLLLKISDSEITTDLSIKDWQILIDKIKVLVDSENSLTYFIEFEGYHEEGNIIIES